MLLAVQQGVLVCYPFLWLKLYMHVFKQRKSKLRKGSRKKRAWENFDSAQLRCNLSPACEMQTVIVDLKESHCELSRDLTADAMVKALLNQRATEYNTSRLLRFMFISVALHFVIVYKICCQSKTLINQSDGPELLVQLLHSGSHTEPDDAVLWVQITRLSYNFARDQCQITNHRQGRVTDTLVHVMDDCWFTDVFVTLM